jgi:hypothetical protein
VGPEWTGAEGQATSGDQGPQRRLELSEMGLLGSGGGSVFGGMGTVSFFEDEVFAALGEPLGDDLSIERIGKDLGPFFERPIGGDGGWGGASRSAR